MAGAMFRPVAILIALAMPCAGWAADPPEVLKVPPRPLDSLKLPPGTVIVITHDPKETFQKIDAVVISPEEYRRLLDADAQLKKQTASDKADPPSVCRLSGKLETRGKTEVMRLRAVFEFTTAAPKAVVPLGGRKAAAVAATLDDGKLPQLQFGDSGYAVVIDAPGRHTVAMEWDLPLQSRGPQGGERGFLLRLPGCPITLLERVELPAAVTTARLRAIPAGAAEPPPVRPLAVKEFLAAGPGSAAMALGSVEAVELFWDAAAPAKPADSLLVGGGEVAVRIDETTVTASAQLAFRSLTGRVAEWKLLAPTGSDVTVDGEAGTSTPGAITVTQSVDKTTWLIRAKDPGVDEVRLTVQTRAPRKPGGVPVGPYQLVGAFRQQGVVKLTAPARLRPRFSNLRADLSRSASEAEGEFAFVIGTGPAAAATPWLVVDADVVRGDVRTQVTHNLTLTEAGWRLASDIRATPVRTELERLDVDLPPGLRDVQCSPPELVDTITPRPDLGPNRWQVRLAHAKTAEVTIRLEGFYPMRAGVRDTALLLPRPVQTFDRDGRVMVTVPDGWEARGEVAEWERDRPGEWGRPLEPAAAPHAVAVTVARTPARVDLTWGRAIAEMAVQSTVDLTLDEQTAVARHRLVFPPAPAARQITLRAAPGTVSQLRAADFDVKPVRDGEWVLALPPSPDREQAAVLNYTARLNPRPNRTVDPGLVWPAAATRCETRVRMWAKPAAGVRPALADGPWEELPAEAVPDRRSLPALVLYGVGVELPLALHLTEIGIVLRPVADSVVVLVRFEDAGVQNYTARFHLPQVQTAALEFELPPDTLNLKVFVNGAPAESYDLLPDAGAGPVIRVPARNGFRDSTVTLVYQRPWDRLAGTAAMLWRWQFTPPRLSGGHVGDVRWVVPLPARSVPLSWSPRTVLQQRWGLWGVLPELRPATVPLPDDGTDATPDAAQSLYTAGLEPVQVMAVPRALWVAVCSLAVLGIGGLLAAVRRRPFALWAGLATLTVAAGVAGVFCPQPALAAVAAGLPGAAVLVPILVTVWALHSRHRRRIEHMPGFVRPRFDPSPSAVNGSSARRRLEPSTVDAPDKP